MNIEVNEERLKKEMVVAMREVLKDIIKEKLEMTDTFDEMIIDAMRKTVKTACDSEETLNAVKQSIVDDLNDRYIVDESIFNILQQHATKVIKESLED